MMLSSACKYLGRYGNLINRRFSPFFTVFPNFPVFHSPGGELVSAVAVSLQPCNLCRAKPKKKCTLTLHGPASVSASFHWCCCRRNTIE